MPRFTPTVQKRLLRLLETLEQDPWPDNLNVTSLSGKRPWIRVRAGNYRVYMRPLSDSELSLLDVELPDVGYYVGRAVDKKDAQRVLRGLPGGG